MLKDKIYPQPGESDMTGTRPIHCQDHSELIEGLATLAVKATYISVALSVNAALLLCIFSTLLINATNASTMAAEMTSIKVDVTELKDLTKDHSSIVTTQKEVLRRLESLESHK